MFDDWEFNQWGICIFLILFANWFVWYNPIISFLGMMDYGFKTKIILSIGSTIACFISMEYREWIGELVRSKK